MLVSVLSSCGGSNQIETTSSHKPGYKIVAEKTYNSEYKTKYNIDSTYIICEKIFKQSPQMPQNRVDFFIYDVSDDKIVFKDNLPNGNVEWLNDHQVKITRLLGIISGIEAENKNSVTLFDINDEQVKPFVENKNK